ncbi:DEAD/DEAH box helicase [Kribbella sp. CA-293567]|uniref:DEAD/DEAH box helicase n=1 Tax=Kribbella sp. CA-293567 TaxID=3002436 RepID=UPI0022DDBB3E|nr:DEAD/DEAH box helicase [Kribbella sp. CA-293567]WBQ05043.1 DEAD/DEAH box helicase [Kribbella sp. CA-293567]
MAFKRRPPTVPAPADPEQLYRILAGSNGGPPALWIHQGDVLREWHMDHSDSKDVAIELPTGAGKTLVGGLIGDFRRRTDSDRVAYLCPTRQLARQTADKLESYGIPSVLLTGQATDWNPADRARYIGAQAVAVSVYGHVFNSNPALGDAQVLILDDAHAAYNATAGPWSLQIRREQPAYLDVVSALTEAIDPLVLERLRTNTPNGKYLANVYMASPIGIHAAAQQLESALEGAAASGTIDKNAKYALIKLRGHLDKCLVFLSYGSLLIRPLIPPTASHPGFDSPRQRVYMSATLGAGGELERVFGRPKIKRIAIPKGWDQQGTGRRFFCFPELTTDLSKAPAGVDDWVASTIKEQGRTVVMVPDKYTAEEFARTKIPAGIEILRASDVEDDLSVFTSKDSAVLMLTNRYDGVDLPNNDCRLVILADLPTRGDLQERFLYSALGANDVLEERVRSRVAQGSGRATRNSGDFSTVVMLDGDLTSFCGRRDIQAAMHPEVHAELKFGFENSLETDSTEMTANIRVFRRHDKEWLGIEPDITADRDTLHRQDPPTSPQLQLASRFEVEAWQAVWQNDLPRALNQARQALDALTHGQASKRYAALWYYLASCWASRLAISTGDTSLTKTSRKYYEDAKQSARGTTWLAHLASPAETGMNTTPDQRDPVDISAARAIRKAAPTIGHAAKFKIASATAREGLANKPATAYENALVYMGQLAGSDESYGNGSATAAPDANWIFGGLSWVCWEAKSEALDDGELGVENVRQAGGHLRYVAGKRGESIPSASAALLMTSQKRVHPAAISVAEDSVYLVRSDVVLDVYDRLIRAWNILRARGLATLTEDDVFTALSTEGALPSVWIAEFCKSPMAALTLDSGGYPLEP